MWPPLLFPQFRLSILLDLLHVVGWLIFHHPIRHRILLSVMLMMTNVPYHHPSLQVVIRCRPSLLPMDCFVLKLSNEWNDPWDETIEWLQDSLIDIIDTGRCPVSIYWAIQKFYHIWQVQWEIWLKIQHHKVSTCPIESKVQIVKIKALGGMLRTLSTRPPSTHEKSLLYS